MSIETGRKAEEVAIDYLKSRGYQILGHNILYPFGELDIVAQDKKYLVFVEVKHRKHALYGMPFEAVTKSKQRKIILAAEAYLKRYQHALPNCRFDVVSLLGDLAQPRIDHIEDAFWAES